MADRLIIRKANDLIEAKCKLTLEEQKIMNFLIAQIQFEDKEFKEYEITVDDFCKVTGCMKSGVYARLIEVGKKLTTTSLILQNGARLSVLTWLSEAHYYTGEGRLTFTFAPSLKPYLIEMKQYGYFTMYEYSNIKRLRSVFSVRLYELLKKEMGFYSKAGDGGLKHYDFGLAKLKNILDVSEKYKMYADFKKNVLLVAQRELQEKCDICFTFEEIRKGRKYQTVRFFITQNKVVHLPQTDAEAEQTDKPIMMPAPLMYCPIPGMEFILENIGAAEYSRIYEAADRDLTKIKRRYDFIKRNYPRPIKNLVGALIDAVTKPDSHFHEPARIEDNPSERPRKKSKFNNFEGHKIDYDELERLELEQFTKSIRGGSAKQDRSR
jgi:plasmid replication initiation protein